jgi:hypothetical protein
LNRRRIGEYKEDFENNANGISEIEAIQSITGIIIRSPNGIPFYQEMFDPLIVSPTLVAGITSAISAFIDELGTSEKMGFEFIERQGMSLSSHNTEMSSIITVSKEKLPIIMLNQIEQAHTYIDTKFVKDFRNRNLINRKKLYEVFEKADFKIALRGKIKINTRKVKRIARVKGISLFVQNQISSFSDLILEYGKEPTYVRLNEIYSFFEKSDLPIDEIANVILVSFKHKVLQPLIDG